MTWSFLTLLPKSDGGVRGIGLLKTTWKVCEAIIDSRVKSMVVFHNSAHGFRTHRGTGTAIIELKLQQELASINKVPLYQVYLDLRKAYNTIDQPHLLQTFEQSSMGP